MCLFRFALHLIILVLVCALPVRHDSSGSVLDLARVPPSKYEQLHLPKGHDPIDGNPRFTGKRMELMRHSKSKAEKPRWRRPDDVAPVFLEEWKKCGKNYWKDVFTPRLTTQEEMDEADTPALVARYKEQRVYHRKQWEYVFLLKILDETLLSEAPIGKKAIGFAVGLEPTVAYLASQNVTVTATDLAQDHPNAKQWNASNQLMGTSLKELNDRDIATQHQMDTYVAQENIDMNYVERSSAWNHRGSFDLVWSICAVEHVGSIRQGLEFMIKSLELLKPGGIAVHTTEFNLKSTLETSDHTTTVQYRKRDIDALYECSINMGYEVHRPCYDIGNGTYVNQVDMPPYQHNPHLLLEFNGYVGTCFGIAIHKPLLFNSTGYDCSVLFDYLT